SNELAAQLTESERTQRRILIIVPSTAVFTLAVAALLGLVVTRSITRPLGSLMAGAKLLAKGDFSHRIGTQGHDEISSLGGVFNDMIVRLQGLYSDIRRSEAFLAEGQRLSLTGSYSWKVGSNEITWSEQLYRIYAFDIGVPVTPELIRTRVHPEDRTLLEIMI